MSFVEMILGLLGVGFVYRKFASYLRKFLLGKLTAVEDIPLLGLPRKDGHKIKGTAVICGGSVAGLFSARVCSDHFENVIIVEPEEWVTTEEGLHDRHREALVPGSSASKRSRIIQYNSIHVTQIFSHTALRKLFPDFDREMEQAGGRFFPTAQQIHVSGVPFVGAYQEDKENTPTTLYFTRPGYETTLRKLVLSHCNNVKYIAGSVTGLTPHKFGKTITSVSVSTNGKDLPTEIPAALVIDCTGPAHGGLKWLQDPRFHVTPSLESLKVSYDPKISYTTCEFNIPPALYENLKTSLHPFDYENKGALVLNISKPGTDPRAIGIQRREGNYLHVLCGGLGWRGKISSPAEVKEFLSQLPVSRPFPGYVHALADFLVEHEVPATYATVRVSPRQYVQYANAKQLPSNFVAIGDSVLELNPMRAQGCTKACIEAVTLNSLLAHTTPIYTEGDDGVTFPADFSRKFFAMQADRTGGLWGAHKISDYVWNTTIPQAGENPNATPFVFMRWYFSQLMDIATKDVQFTTDFWRVENFLAPPTDFFAPRTLRKVLWNIFL